MNSVEKDGKLTVKKPNEKVLAKALHAKTDQPIDHPSEEVPISSQEYEEHYNRELDEQEASEDEEDDGFSSDEEDEEEDEDESESESEEGNENDPIDEIDFPCNVFFPARRFGGKTNAIELILQQRGDEFDQVFIIGRSSATKDKLKKYGRGVSNNSDLYFLRDLSDDFLNELLKSQKKTKANTLLVFDDATGMKFNLATSKPFDELCATGRNDNISCLFGVQSYKKAPAILRDNSEYRMLGLNYQRCAEQIASEYGNARATTKQLREIMKNIDRNNTDDFKSFYFMDGKRGRQYMWEPPLAE